jgi:uncharacterized spore protein YtfJ
VTDDAVGAGGGGALPRLVDAVREAMTVSRVFGQPYERDGVTVIPAATVRGGGGGGSGRNPATGEDGDGGGFGVIARPAGAYVIKDGEVSWQPAVDVNRIVALGIAGWVAVAWLLARSTSRKRRR